MKKRKPGRVLTTPLARFYDPAVSGTFRKWCIHRSKEVRIMTITRRPSPFGELLSLRQAMDRLFEDSFVRPTGWTSSALDARTLPVDVSMSSDELVVEAQLPGLKPEDVEITLENGTLTIRGETAEDREERKDDYLVREIRRGTFSRSISLPNGLQAENAAATFENGTLTLRIPKAEEVKPRQIRISPTTNGSTNGQRTPPASDEHRAG
jgi:HSP20 family protein